MDGPPGGTDSRPLAAVQWSDLFRVTARTDDTPVGAARSTGMTSHGQSVDEPPAEGGSLRAVQRLKIGIIGCGAIAQIQHLPHLRELDDQFAIGGLSDLSPKLLAYVGEQYGVPAE